MPVRAEDTVKKRRERVAADYRQRGYHVVHPKSSGDLPAFLRDHLPDLVAESADDRVVVEVKSARALKGSNELTELAARVASQPGWRFELVTIGSEDAGTTAILDPDWLEAMLRRSYPVEREVFYDVYLIEVLGCLVRGLAMLNNIKAAGKSIGRLAQELTFAGALPQETLERIGTAVGWGDALMQRRPAAVRPERFAEEVKALCREIMDSARGSAVQ